MNASAASRRRAQEQLPLDGVIVVLLLLAVVRLRSATAVDVVPHIGRGGGGGRRCSNNGAADADAAAVAAAVTAAAAGPAHMRHNHVARRSRTV